MRLWITRIRGKNFRKIRPPWDNGEVKYVRARILLLQRNIAKMIAFSLCSRPILLKISSNCWAAEWSPGSGTSKKKIQGNPFIHWETVTQRRRLSDRNHARLSRNFPRKIIIARVESERSEVRQILDEVYSWAGITQSRRWRRWYSVKTNSINVSSVAIHRTILDLSLFVRVRTQTRSWAQSCYSRWDSLVSISVCNSSDFPSEWPSKIDDLR